MEAARDGVAGAEERGDREEGGFWEDGLSLLPRECLAASRIIPSHPIPFNTFNPIQYIQSNHITSHRIQSNHIASHHYIPDSNATPRRQKITHDRYRDEKRLTRKGKKYDDAMEKGVKAYCGAGALAAALDAGERFEREEKKKKKNNNNNNNSNKKKEKKKGSGKRRSSKEKEKV